MIDAITSTPTRLRDAMQEEPYLRAKLLVIAFVLVFPFITPSSFSIDIATQIMILAIFAISYDILLGYTGLVSFGHALPYGLGAYVVTIAVVWHDVNMVLGVALALLLVTVASVIVGLLSLQLTGIYFAIITLAFAHIVYLITVQFTWLTGGADGIVGMPRPELLSLLPFSPAINFYFYVFVIFIVSFLLIRHILRSPFGRVFQAIRENEQRVQLLGVNTYLYKVASFVLAGFFAGLAGILHVQYLGFTGTGLLFWTKTADVLFVAIIGGVGTLIGPVVGATALLFFEDIIGELFEPALGRMIIGITFIIFVLFIPKGIVGVLKGPRFERVREVVGTYLR